MARIPGSQNDKIYTISKWLGVNECADGDTNLRMGEASVMTNFRITDDLSLQKRPGTQLVANLLSEYTVDAADTTTNVKTENGLISTAAFDCYPGYSITSGGLLTTGGIKTAVNYNNITDHAGKYWLKENGKMYRLGTCVYTHPTGIPVSGGYIHIVGSPVGGIAVCANTISGSLSFIYYTTVQIFGDHMNPGGTPVTQGLGGIEHLNEALGKYVLYNGKIYKLTGYSTSYDPAIGYGATYYGFEMAISTDAKYEWLFYEMTVVANTTDSQVRGIWAGRVGTTDDIISACNGHLWSLSKSGDVWSKTDIGSINTEKPVHFFGFNDSLYMMNGSEYKVWNGVTLLEVAGYRPLVAVAVPPAGGGTALQRINMLNGMRRVWFSPDGTATTFHLPEKDLASVDYARVIANGAAPTISSTSLAAGTVTFSSAPASGTDTIEIGYTVSATYRDDVLAMTLSELYNGVGDNRVFIYGDGSNKAFYSDLDYNGQATAEYFPDLNVVHFGDSNTPLTSMIRHYDRLLAFKTDSAYSVAYNTITLPTGAVTAGFYVTTINKGIGSAGYGQAVMVGNQPRTLDGRSIYEWVATSTSGEINNDQRNAQRISQKVQRTLREIMPEDAIAFHDKVNQEYFVVENSIAIVQNTANGAWYIYRDFPALCMIVYMDELYFGTADGSIRHVSRDYLHDAGQPIACYWESGSMNFGAGFARKYSDEIWVVLKPEDNASVNVTVQTDRQSDYGDVTSNTCKVITGFFDFLHFDFESLTFNVSDKPQTRRHRIKVKNFAWYKLLFSAVTNDTTATILSTSIKIRQTGMVR